MRKTEERLLYFCLPLLLLVALHTTLNYLTTRKVGPYSAEGNAINKWKIFEKDGLKIDALCFFPRTFLNTDYRSLYIKQSMKALFYSPREDILHHTIKKFYTNPLINKKYRL